MSSAAGRSGSGGTGSAERARTGGAERARGAGRTGGTRSTGSLLSSVAVALGCVLFLGGFVWGAVVYQPYTVPTDSMAPTVGSGDKVLAERIDGGDVRRGDVVVFEDKVWGDVPMVKRVVAVGGDTVRCCVKGNRLEVNGKPVTERYVTSVQLRGQDPFPGTEVPRGKLFVLGDHRADSVDSREHLTDAAKGSVPRSAVKARVEATVWPLGGAGMLPKPSGFAAVPGGVSPAGPLPMIVTAVIVGAVLVLGGAAYGPVAGRLERRRHGGR
jgi:signal peptidase I